MHCHSLLQGILLSQGLNLGLLYCRQILYYLSHQGSPHTILDRTNLKNNNINVSNPCVLLVIKFWFSFFFFFNLTLFMSTYVFSHAYCFGSISAMLCCRQSSRNSVLTGLYCLVRAMLLWPLVEPWPDSSSSAVPSPSLQGGPAVAASAVLVALFPDFSRRVTQHDSATWI